MLDQKTTSQNAQGTPVLDAYAEFIASREVGNAARGTLDYYRRKLRPFCVWCESNGAPTVSGIAATHIRNYILTLKGRNLSPWTMHGATRAIKAFLRFCQSEGMIADVPKITMPKLPKELPQPLSAVDVSRLLDVCECERDRAIVYVLLDTGLRASELIALDGRDIDPSSGTIFVRSGKGAKDRVTFIGAKTQKAILRYWREAHRPDKHDPAWATRTAPYERFTVWGLTSMLRRMSKRAGVAGVTPHRFRRTFAVWSLRAGMDVLTLQRIMGHSELATTRRYVNLVDDDLRTSHRKHGAVDSFLK